jgi:hypothetical protein
MGGEIWGLIGVALGFVLAEVAGCGDSTVRGADFSGRSGPSAAPSSPRRNGSAKGATVRRLR